MSPNVGISPCVFARNVLFFLFVPGNQTTTKQPFEACPPEWSRVRRVRVHPLVMEWF